MSNHTIARTNTLEEEELIKKGEVPEWGIATGEPLDEVISMTLPERRQARKNHRKYLAEKNKVPSIDESMYEKDTFSDIIEGVQEIEVKDIDDNELYNYEPISQEGYGVLKKNSNKNGLITWGINPCIIIAFYNPNHGIYLIHTLGLNYFYNEQISSGCHDENGNFLVKETFTNECMLHPILPIPYGKSISESFPEWIHSENTIGKMYARTTGGVTLHLVTRYNQLKKIYKGKLEVYKNDYKQAVMINKDGNFFCPVKDQYYRRDLDNYGKQKDMYLIRVQLSYFFDKEKQKHKKLNEIIRNQTDTKDDDYLNTFLDKNLNFKSTAYKLENHKIFGIFRGHFAVKGLIFRSCVIDQSPEVIELLPPISRLTKKRSFNSNKQKKSRQSRRTRKSGNSFSKNTQYKKRITRRHSF